jgi:hypothetical protein
MRSTYCHNLLDMYFRGRASWRTATKTRIEGTWAEGNQVHTFYAVDKSARYTGRHNVKKLKKLISR